MSAQPMVLAFRFPPENLDATKFGPDDWVRCEVSMQVRRPFQGKRLCVIPSEWVRIFGVRVGAEEVLSAVPGVSCPSDMFPVWTEERAAVEGFSNLVRRTAYPGDSITVSFECRAAVFAGFSGVIFGNEWRGSEAALAETLAAAQTAALERVADQRNGKAERET